jgi:hypothetical protein
MRIWLSIIALLILTGCAPTEETINLHVVGTLAAIPTATTHPTSTAYPTYTPYPTFTSVYTQTPWVIIVTPTATQTPNYTPTMTATPAPTDPPTNTPDPLYGPHEPGIYLVNIDIGPGIWRSDPNTKSDDCYWVITDPKGEIIDNHFGMSGGTMYISPNAFQVEMESACGIWTFLRAK